MRIENDSIGSIPIHADSYNGIHTFRARMNFDISKQEVDRVLLYQIAQIKAAAAIANQQTGKLSALKARTIVDVVDEILDGQWDQELRLDAFQGGAGTSTNMLLNEFIANRGLERLGHLKGEYQYLHPLDDINQSQSTNDVYPSAGKLAVFLQIHQLLEPLQALMGVLDEKAVAFANTQKMGRTQLQDAVPTTFGQSFQAYGNNLKRCAKRLRAIMNELTELNLGGTAIGTCVNASMPYRTIVYRELKKRSKIAVKPAADFIDATQNLDVFVMVSSVLKALAVSLLKMCHDLRLLSSGPRAGLAELALPARQAGSSIMPGKVNPVIPEVVSQIAFQVMGNDTTITIAAESGELELNAFEPVIFHNLFESIQLLNQGCRVLNTHCLADIQVNSEKCLQDVSHGTALATKLAPIIGYERASNVVKESLLKNIPVEELLGKESFEALSKQIG